MILCYIVHVALEGKRLRLYSDQRRKYMLRTEDMHSRDHAGFPAVYSSFHFLFHYPNITPIVYLIIPI